MQKQMEIKSKSKVFHGINLSIVVPYLNNSDLFRPESNVTNTNLLIHPGSILHAMFSRRFDTKPDKDGTYFIDRDGTHFRYILNYLRTRELVVPDDKTVRYELLIEATFLKWKE